MNIKKDYDKVKKIILSCKTKEQLYSINQMDIVGKYYEKCLRHCYHHQRDSIKYNAGKLMGIMEYKIDLILNKCDN